MRVAGLGCRRGVDLGEVLAALQGAGPVDLLAVPPAKADEPALRAAAVHLGLPLVVAEAGAFASARTLTVTAATGAPSASEAAALAAAGPGARLTGPRRIAGRVTCAVAVSVEDEG